MLQVVPTRAEVPDSGDNELERSIKAAMMRMKKVAADSDEEDRGDDETQSTDWGSLAAGCSSLHQLDTGQVKIQRI